MSAVPTDRDPALCPHQVRFPLMEHRWERLTFLHWRYDPRIVQFLLPPGLTVQTYEGDAWVGLVPFYLRVSLPRTPSVPWPTRFCETNVRTYVHDGQGTAGVWFFSLDAARLAAVLAARTTYRLPYFWSDMSLIENGESIEYRTERRWPQPSAVTSRVAVRRGDAFRTDELTVLDHFLTARWIVFCEWRDQLIFARASHPPWPLHRAELLVLEDHLVEAAGLPSPEGDPLVHYSPGVDVRLGRPQKTVGTTM